MGIEFDVNEDPTARVSNPAEQVSRLSEEASILQMAAGGRERMITEAPKAPEKTREQPTAWFDQSKKVYSLPADSQVAVQRSLQDAWRDSQRLAKS